MTIAVGTVLKAVSEMSTPGGHLAQNVWYWRLIGGNPLSEATALTLIATKINAIWQDVETYIASNVSLDTVAVHEWDWNGVDAWETGLYIGEAALSDSFAGAAAMLPHIVAAIITMFTSDVNRRSRKSFVGFIEAAQTESYLDGAPEAALIQAATEWLADIVVGGGDFLEPVLAGNDGVVYPLLVGLATDLLGSQIRRKPGVGA